MKGEKRKRLFVISGPSGCGKNTVFDELKKRDGRITQTVSATTRDRRDGETDGLDYYFLSEEDFLNKVQNGDFVEYVRYGSNYYGTLKSEIDRLCDSGKIVILIIEVNGAANIKKLYPDLVSVFIMPPSEEELIKRILKRGTNSEEDIASRIKIAGDEMLCKDSYDYCVVNDCLEECVDKIYKIITETGEKQND